MTGNKVDDDGDGAAGNDVKTMVTAQRATGCNNEDNGNGLRRATKLTMMAMGDEVDDDGKCTTGNELEDDSKCRRLR